MTQELAAILTHKSIIAYNMGLIRTEHDGVYFDPQSLKFWTTGDNRSNKLSEMTVFFSERDGRHQVRTGNKFIQIDPIVANALIGPPPNDGNWYVVGFLDRQSKNLFVPGNLKWVEKTSNRGNDGSIWKSGNRFKARVCIKKINYYLGSFATMLDAKRAINKKKQEMGIA